jgi:hypothetical protein
MRSSSIGFAAVSDVLNFDDMGVYDSINDSVVSYSQLPVSLPIAVERITRVGIVHQLVQGNLKSSSEFGGDLLDIA